MDYLEAVTSAAGFFMVIFKFIFKLEHIVNLHLNFDSVSMQKKKKNQSQLECSLVYVTFFCCYLDL